MNTDNNTNANASINIDSKKRLACLEIFRETLATIKKFVKKNNAAVLAQCLIGRSDLCASSINRALGTGTEFHLYGAAIARLDASRVRFRDELRTAKRTKLGKEERNAIRGAIRDIDRIYSDLSIGTPVQLDELAKANDTLLDICNKAKVEVERWAKGNTRTPKKRTQEDCLKEAVRCLNRSCRLLAEAGAPGKAAQKILDDPIDKALQLIKQQLAETKTAASTQPPPTEPNIGEDRPAA